MKDCSSCEHSALNNPEIAGRDYKDTPCANCEPSEIVSPHISFGPQFEHPREGTWKILEPIPTEPISDLAYQLLKYLRHNDEMRKKIRIKLEKRHTGKLRQVITRFSRREEKVLARLADDNWATTQCDVARDLGISKQAVNKISKSIIKIAPQFKRFI